MKYPVAYFQILFAGFVLILGYSMLRAFLPFHARDLDPTGLSVGFTMSSYFFARMLIGLPSGFIADKIGRRASILLGLGFSMIGSLVCAFSTFNYILILGLMLWGLGAGLFFTTSMVFVIDLFKIHIRGRALGTFYGIEFLASFVGSALGGFLAEYLGYETVFYTVGALIALTFSYVFMSKDFKKVASQMIIGHARMSARRALNDLKNRGLLVTCIVALLRMLVMQGVVSTILPIYLADFAEMNLWLIGIIFSIRTVGLSLSIITCGYIVDKIGKKPVIFTGICLQGFSTGFYVLARSFELTLSIAFVEGLGAGIIWLALTTFMSEQVTSKGRGGAVGLYHTFHDIGAVIGPMLFITTERTFGTYTSFFFGGALLLANIPILSIVESRWKARISSQ